MTPQPAEKPQGIHPARVIITLIPDDEKDENHYSMELSQASFDEWDNEVDSIYDTL